jgi:acyl carrier protein
MEIAELINEIALALEVPIDRINAETTSEEIDEWDSLGQISILARLDLAYDDITEKVSDLASALSVAEIYTLLRAAGL